MNYRIILTLLVYLCSIPLSQAVDKPGEEFPTYPVDNDGKKWRIGYVEANKYKDYQASLIAIVKGLERSCRYFDDSKTCWLDGPIELPPQEDNQDTQKLWQWLATEVKSNYVQFVADAYWTADTEEQRQANKKQIAPRLQETKDIDLIISMGTKAGLDLVEIKHAVPTIIASVSDPVKSKIITNNEDSGIDNVVAKVDPYRYERQVEIFYKIFKFERLGITYVNSPEGQAIAAIPSVERVTDKYGITLYRCYIKQFDNPNVEEGLRDLERCHREFGQRRVRAVYITINKLLDQPENLVRVLKPLNENRILTFSQGSSTHVKYGVLMSMAVTDFSYVGNFYAEKIAKIFNGAKPRELNQIFTSPTTIAINLDVAGKLGFDLPIDILGAADEIYQKTIELVSSPASEKK
jgi:ABC-type uncharacterized transport system substrate-binding protein